MNIKHVYLGKMIKRLRVDAGLTQLDVSAELGLTGSQFISNCERGLCSVSNDMVIDLCNMIGIKPVRYCEIVADLHYLMLIKDLDLATDKKLHAIAEDMIN